MGKVGRAILLTIDLDDPYANGPMWEGPFDEREGDAHHEHPIARAEALWESIKGDWPNMQSRVVANDRAHALATAYRMEQIGFDYNDSLEDAQCA